MPVSKKQLRANRQNAQKCTGPKSVEGKAIASRNATKHGMYSRDLIIQSANLTESREEFERLHESLIEELQPQSLFQEYLVGKIAGCLWRSRRAVRAETAEITGQLDDIDIDSSVRKEFLKIAHQIDGSKYQEISRNEELRQASIEIGRQSIPNQESSFNILRYEMRLDRQLTRAYKLLCQLQDRQNRDKTDTGSREEIFVPVFKCPAEHGMECPRDPQSSEGHRGHQEKVPDAAERDAIESRPRGAGHPGSVETPEEGFERATVDVQMERTSMQPRAMTIENQPIFVGADLRVRRF